MDRNIKILKSTHGSFDGGGLYVHVAYCRKKCIYCDFFSAGDRIADWHRYVDAISSEFQFRINELAWPLRTVYFGGGTPSLMPAEEFLRLCEFLKPYMTEVEEFTLEVNPDDVNVRMLEIWKRGGVNRLSIGIQTFDDSSLKALGRRHDGTDALQAYRLARKFFDNISVDLMFGLPGQTLDVWYRDLQIALELRPEHISAYSLMYEEGTVLTALRDSGRLEEISEEMSEMMFRLLMEKLAKAGYDHYEISNFALPGYRSRHNTSYWLQKPYIGLGPSAHSYDGERKRKANRAALRSYLDRWTPCDGIVVNEEDVMEIENLCEEELMEEYILTRTRMREGIPLEHFAGLFGMQALDRLLVNAAPLVNEGKVLLTDSHISLSEDAIMLSDSLILRLVESLC